MENIGKVLIGLGKLIFGAMFLGGVLRGELPQVILITVGFFAAILFFAVGIRWVAKGSGG